MNTVTWMERDKHLWCIAIGRDGETGSIGTPTSECTTIRLCSHGQRQRPGTHLANPQLLPDDEQQANAPPRAILLSWATFERRFGVRVFEWYGAIEGGLAFRPPGVGPPASFGRPVPGLEMRIVDELMAGVPYDEFVMENPADGAVRFGATPPASLTSGTRFSP